MAAAVAVILAAAPGSAVPAAAETPAEFAALLRSGFPCPQPGAGPVRGTADADAAGPAPRGGEPALRSGLLPAPTVARSAEGDLALVRWSGVTFSAVSGEFPVLVEEGTVGLMIRAQARNDRFRISVELMDPSGGLIACEDCPEAPAVGEINAGRGTTQMPSTDRPGWELAPGRYTFRVRATPDLPELDPAEDVTVDITATLRTDAAVRVERFLDLNFIYLPGCGLNRETAPASPEFLAMIDAVAEALAPTGINIGSITHRNLDRPGFSLISDWDQAANLFRGSGGLGRERALSVYCVRGFEEPLYPAVGLSGGIPGPIDSGTPDSGIIIRLSPLLTCHECTDAFASLFVHEFGHYLGLYHTTEVDPAVADPFSDTPRCGERDLRQCPDWPYVMFPVIHPANRVWSPGQIAVVQTHPMISTVPVVGGPLSGSREAPDAPATAGPNPFRDQTELRWTGAGTAGDGGGEGGDGGEAARVSARVYDVSGRLIRDLGSGRTAFRWDGQDHRGVPAPDGVYFVRFMPERGDAHTLRIVKVR